jgi:hypothetical protein
MRYKVVQEGKGRQEGFTQKSCCFKEGDISSCSSIWLSSTRAVADSRGLLEVLLVSFIPYVLHDSDGKRHEGISENKQENE